MLLTVRSSSAPGQYKHMSSAAPGRQATGDLYIYSGVTFWMTLPLSQRCNILNDPPLVSCQATGEVDIYCGVTFWETHPNMKPSIVSCEATGEVYIYSGVTSWMSHPKSESSPCVTWGYRGCLHLQRCDQGLSRYLETGCPNRGFIDFCVSKVWYKIHTTNKIDPIPLQILLF